MPRKGFPQTSSLPSFRKSEIQSFQMRSIEAENIQNLPASSSPFSNYSDEFLKTSSISFKNKSREEEKNVSQQSGFEGRLCDKKRCKKIRFYLD
jgi:hypothetical protein